MAQYNLGKVSIRPRGAYSSSTNYTPLDMVTNLGGSWLCIAAAQGVQPGVSSNWANYWLNTTKGIRTVTITSPATGKATVTVTLSDGTQTSLTIDTAAIGTGAVGTDELADRSVTNAKIAQGAVDVDNLTQDAKGLSFNVTLAVASWANNQLTISNQNFVTTGAAYIVSPAPASFAAYAEAVIYADDVTTAGKMTFHCVDVPTSDIVVNIIRVVST